MLHNVKMLKYLLCFIINIHNLAMNNYIQERSENKSWRVLLGYAYLIEVHGYYQALSERHRMVSLLALNSSGSRLYSFEAVFIQMNKDGFQIYLIKYFTSLFCLTGTTLVLFLLRHSKAVKCLHCHWYNWNSYRLSM